MLDRCRSVLRSHGGRWTKEREALLQVIGATESHFTVDDICGKLRTGGLKVAEATVYRNLGLLVQAGIIRRACLAEESGGGARYEHIWGKEHHDHLVCSSCGRREDFFYPAIDVLQEDVARQFGFVLEGHHLELTGLCPDCGRTRAAIEQRDRKKPTGAQKTLTLVELTVGTVAEVTKFANDDGLAAKMNALGIYTTNQIKLLRRGPFGGPLLIEHLDSGGRVMVAEKLARHVEVKEAEHGAEA
jgi:Fur family ferric uptake transcriptional regulator